jgi:hypothetical protein
LIERRRGVESFYEFDNDFMENMTVAVNIPEKRKEQVDGK